MLDVSLRDVAFRYDRGFALHAITVTIPRSTHTAIVGPASCGASTLLQLIAGTLKPASGEIILGQRRVNDVKPAQRPLLFVTSELEVPGRWSVEHVLIAAVRARSLDREDRHREYRLASEKWELDPLLARRTDSLSSTERTRVQLARIELLRPAVLLADRVLERVSASARVQLADAFYRTMRVSGTTVVTVPSSRDELAFTDAVAVLHDGRVVQSGAAAEVFARPFDDAAAVATGDVDVVPVTIRGTTVESVMGAWEVDPAPFQGSGVALVRPGDFRPARGGEDSDFVFGVEEAGFTDGRWIVHGVLSGGVRLRVSLPAEERVHKGRLLALRYDAARFRLLPREMAPLQPTIPTDVVPSLRDSR
ncbi:MAG TPA: ATP-binding cassette domain-containing protein [Thermoanaerobaculia bacterium]|nr:ATP-binding cassette domain-containing protein [Thermoanaerobaculia bacterium]